MSEDSGQVETQARINALIQSKRYISDSSLYSVFFAVLWFLLDGFLLGNTTDFDKGIVAYFFSSVFGTVLSVAVFFAIGRFYVHMHIIIRFLFSIAILFVLLVVIIELGFNEWPLIMSKMIAINFLVHGLSVNRIKQQN